MSSLDYKILDAISYDLKLRYDDKKLRDQAFCYAFLEKLHHNLISTLKNGKESHVMEINSNDYSKTELLLIAKVLKAFCDDLVDKGFYCTIYEGYGVGRQQACCLIKTLVVQSPKAKL